MRTVLIPDEADNNPTVRDLDGIETAGSSFPRTGVETTETEPAETREALEKPSRRELPARERRVPSRFAEFYTRFV